MVPPIEPVLAADLMQRKVFALSPEWTLERGVHDLLRHGFSGAPVVDAQHRLVGVLSEANCLEILAADAFHDTPSGLVADAMHREVVTVRPETDVFRLVQLFRENPYRRLPVVDGDGRMVGLITRRDLLRGLDLMRRRRAAGIGRESTYDTIREHWEHRD
jgi:CBS-domain-containing membrane protein